MREYSKGPDSLELFNVKSVAVERRTGALWVLAGKNDPPIAFLRNATQGKAVSSLGYGPGEFQRASALAAGPLSGMGVLDMGRRRWTWLDANGRELSGWVVPLAMASSPVFVDVGGNVHITVRRRADLPPARTVVAHFTEAGALADTSPIPIDPDPGADWKFVTSGMAPGVRGPVFGLGTMRVEFSPRVMWGVDVNGRTWYARGDSNFVTVLDQERERRLYVPLNADELTRDEKNRVRKALDDFERRTPAQIPASWPKGAFTTPRPPVPRLHPEIDELLMETNGGIALVRSLPCSRLPWSRAAAGSKSTGPALRCQLVERFSADLRRLQPFALAAGDSLKAIRGDTLWAVRVSEAGLASIVEMVVPERR